MTDPREELSQMLQEPLGSVRVRERAVAKLLGSPEGPPLVLFGAGNMGRQTAVELRQRGVRCAAFSDNATRLWGTEVEGLPVLAPPEAAARFGDSGIFVVTIWHPFDTHRFADTRQQLSALGCAMVLPFAPLFWSYPERLLPHMGADLPSHVAAARDQVWAAGELWSDASSRGEYLAQVRWRLWGDLSGLPPPVEHETYFPPDLFALGEDDVIADCGAFDGDTIRCLVERLRLPFKQLHAFEPDPRSFAALRDYVTTLPPPTRERIVLHQLAVSSHRATARFTSDGTMGAALSDDGQVTVECAALDEVLAATPSTFIKLDVEGAEADALWGARAILRDHRPVVAVCVYHRQPDLWELPLLLRSLCHDSSFFLRPHLLEGFDLVCYAVPQERLLSPSA